ncbi:MAG TPA: rRNA maturation RNase YbeY [Micropepsaceae bacterium]|jgi:probable rRNA maturation factor|nr:rRNA maturation RNase YbeY [Micropepsaceae bacterium]
MKKASAAGRRSKKAAKPPPIVLIVEDAHWRNAMPDARLMRRAVRLALDGSPHAPTILLTSSARLRALNAAFRGKDKATNVLSFASATTDPSSLGDIAMAYGVVRREAREQRKNFADHAAHLALHGTLHLLGWDHENAKDARNMEALEIELLASLGIADPYRIRPYTQRRKAS